MYLYHGTPADFDVPTLSKCKPHRDFGCGFYLAPNYFDALPMAIKNSRFGYVQTYLLTDLDGLSVLEFDERSEDWLRFVVSSRLGTAPNVDLVIGYMAGGGSNLKSKFTKLRNSMLANPKRTKDEIVQWIREYFAANGNDCCAVIGISGGKDSSVVAALCVEALGVERVIGVLMPNGWQKDIADSKLLVDTLGIASVTVDIGGAYSKMVDVVGRVMPSGVSNQAAVNLPPRLRMATLYMVAQSLARGGRVANTCNRSEDYVGYSTKFGDSAGDFSPLANIMVHEVRQIGYELPIPRELVDKTPSDGLCGKTDEDNLGFTYMQLDNYIMHGSSGDEDIDKVIAKKHMQNLHKLNPMPAYGSQP